MIFEVIRKVFIVILNSRVNDANLTELVSLSNQKYKINSTLISYILIESGRFKYRCFNMITGKNELIFEKRYIM